MGDPTLLGWLTTALYFAASLLSWRVGASLSNRAQGVRPARDAVFFWLGLVILLLGLGVNKQLDLQTPFLGWMKELSQQRGWYESRKLYQRAFIAGLTLATAVSVVLLSRTVMRLGRGARLAAFGVGSLLLFVLLRASLFQGFSAPSVVINVEEAASHGLEAASLVIIIAGALRQLRSPPRSE